jgi:hypothetical protein
MSSPLEATCEFVANVAQSVLRGPPVIILGSGASLAYGVGGMSELGEYLRETVKPQGVEETETWNRFLAALSKTNNLEAALQNVDVSGRLLGEIIQATHQLVAKDDLRVLASVVEGHTKLALTRLLRHLFQSTHQRLSIVTPNYDRLAEYAAHVAGYSHYSGFLPGHIGLFADAKPPEQQKRCVNVWKVHGSIDWFEDQQQQPICVPDVSAAQSLLPLIVTPGNTKYERALQEPFRTCLSMADVALSEASAYLCVGFGFRDSHIEPKLVRRLRQKNAPVIILAKTLTGEARKFISSHLKQDFVALE